MKKLVIVYPGYSTKDNHLTPQGEVQMVSLANIVKYQVGEYSKCAIVTNSEPNSQVSASAFKIVFPNAEYFLLERTDPPGEKESLPQTLQDFESVLERKYNASAPVSSVDLIIVIPSQFAFEPLASYFARQYGNTTFSASGSFGAFALVVDPILKKDNSFFYNGLSWEIIQDFHKMIEPYDKSIAKRQEQMRKELKYYSSAGKIAELSLLIESFQAMKKVHQASVEV